MRKLLTGFIDILFPPSSDELLLRHVTPNIWENVYQPGVYRTTTYLAHYQQSLVQAAIKENKFHHRKHATTLLASLLLRWPPAQKPDTVFIPIPLGKQRQRDRGHNQVLSVLRAAGLLEKTVTSILERSIETLPQSHLGGAKRAQNIKHAFTCREEKISELQKYTRIVLLDDVVTTGATLEAAKAALLPHLPPHIPVDCVALAH